MKVCFNRKSPKHWRGFLILLQLKAAAELFPCTKDTVISGLMDGKAQYSISVAYLLSAGSQQDSKMKT